MVDDEETEKSKWVGPIGSEVKTLESFIPSPGTIDKGSGVGKGKRIT